MTPKSLYDFPTIKKYLDRIGAEERSLTKAVIKEQHGNYWTDICIIKFKKTGEVEAPESYMPNEQEAIRIKEEMAQAVWPEQTFIDMNSANMPKMVTEANPDDVFQFKDINGNVTMLQVRKERKGQKSYIPITAWSDGEFRFIEPEGNLPLYGLENLKDHTTVIISEGAKAARMGQRIANGEVMHPWSQELSSACHLGFIGGALSPERSDWAALKKHGITRAYVVQDNDEAGRSVLPKIAVELFCPTFAIQFTSEFPVSYDLADPVPESLYRKIGGKKYFCGPTFRECLHPATYMTNLVKIIKEDGKEKTVPVLRHHARDLWTYIEETDVWVSTDFPEIIRRAEILDKMLFPFSDSKRTTDLLLQAYTGRTPAICYRPDKKGRLVTNNGSSAINLYVPPSIKGQEGDIAPFMEFMEYLIPDEKDRYETLKWIATLIGKPETRMLYGLLLISSKQGVGKTTLAEQILAPLVGLNNTAFPGESDIIDSNFNGWMAAKRLCVIAEIYSGSSWKAANRLKSYITDTHISVNPKFERPYKIENWAHFCASSNSYNALKMEQSDRRWMVPGVTEEKWPSKKFDEFFDWLNSGGLSIIKYWAEIDWKEYIKRGDAAPMSRGKAEMIDDSRSEAQSEAISLATMMNTTEEEISIGFRDIKNWLEVGAKKKFFDSDHDIRKSMIEAGVIFSKKRISIDGREQSLAMNKACVDAIKGLTTEDEKVKTAKSFRKKPEDILGEMM